MFSILLNDSYNYCYHYHYHCSLLLSLKLVNLTDLKTSHKIDITFCLQIHTPGFAS